MVGRPRRLAGQFGWAPRDVLTLLTLQVFRLLQRNDFTLTYAQD